VDKMLEDFNNAMGHKLYEKCHERLGAFLAQMQQIFISSK
jgi:hypothetical protein